jgi:hypothetical protein
VEAVIGQARGVSNIDALFTSVDEADLREPLEHFVASALFDAGVWASPRTSDGIAALRVVERGDGGERVVTWSLFFDIDAARMSERRARNAIDCMQAATDVEWRVSLGGTE